MGAPSSLITGAVEEGRNRPSATCPHQVRKSPSLVALGADI